MEAIEMIDDVYKSKLKHTYNSSRMNCSGDVLLLFESEDIIGDEAFQ